MNPAPTHVSAIRATAGLAPYKMAVPMLTNVQRGRTSALAGKFRRKNIDTTTTMKNITTKISKVDVKIHLANTSVTVQVGIINKVSTLVLFAVKEIEVDQ